MKITTLKNFKYACSMLHSLVEIIDSNTFILKTIVALFNRIPKNSLLQNKASKIQANSKFKLSKLI